MPDSSANRDALPYGKIAIPLSAWACPRCKGALLAETDDQLRCATCGEAYPVVHGVPILINDERSVFAKGDYVGGVELVTDWNRLATRDRSRNPLRVLMRLIVDHRPALARVTGVGLTPHDALRWVLAEKPDAAILVLGCFTQQYAAPPPAKIVYTDVSLGPLTEIVCDANDIPFAPSTFDLVLSVSLIGNVADPQRVADEVVRVLKPDGFVFDNAQFMQQVSSGAYDFTRFTYMGHRRLWRAFDEIRRGMWCGPAAALAWSIAYFVESFFEGARTRQIIRLAAQYGLFWMKYMDLYLMRKKGAYDAASAFYFFGRKRIRPLTDREIIATHVGLRPK